MTSLSEPAKLLLLVTLLAKDQIISNNGKAYIKELILRRDPRLGSLINSFEQRDGVDLQFLESVHTLIGQESLAVYEELFAETSLERGKTLSKDERERKHLKEEKSLIYGEVEFDSFYRILRKIAPQCGSVFYDLGSGTGKALFVARLTRDFRRCVGIEILESLHQEAENIVEKFNRQVKDQLFLGDRQSVEVVQGSFLDFDWSDGDLVFANSTCFSDELLHSVAVQARQLKPGSIVVTFTKGLNDDAYFEVLLKQRYRMSWGPATVFIHRRKAPASKPLPPYKLNFLPSDADAYYSEESPSLAFQGVTPQYASADIDEEDDPVQQGGEDDEDEEEDDEDDDNEDEDNEDNEGDDNELGEAVPSKSQPVATPPQPPAIASPTKTARVVPTPASPLLPPPPNAQESFAMLNSPQDTALLMRKRSLQSPQKQSPGQL